MCVAAAAGGSRHRIRYARPAGRRAPGRAEARAGSAEAKLERELIEDANRCNQPAFRQERELNGGKARLDMDRRPAPAGWATLTARRRRRGGRQIRRRCRAEAPSRRFRRRTRAGPGTPPPAAGRPDRRPCRDAPCAERAPRALHLGAPPSVAATAADGGRVDLEPVEIGLDPQAPVGARAPARDDRGGQRPVVDHPHRREPVEHLAPRPRSEAPTPPSGGRARPATAAGGRSGRSDRRSAASAAPARSSAAAGLRVERRADRQAVLGQAAVVHPTPLARLEHDLDAGIAGRGRRRPTTVSSTAARLALRSPYSTGARDAPLALAAALVVGRRPPSADPSAA